MSLRPAPWPFLTNGARRDHARPSEVKPPRPHLEVLEGGAKDPSRHLPPRGRLVAAAGVVAAVLFGVVAFHVVLSQGQFRLEKLQQKADQQQDQYQRLRLQVAQLESPERISSEAQNRLGMVPAANVTPLAPGKDDVSPALSAPAPTPAPAPGFGSADASSSSTGINNINNDNDNDNSAWAKVKPELSAPAQ